jgi:ATP-binding cassette, subfamily B, bacterial
MGKISILIRLLNYVLRYKSVVGLLIFLSFIGVAFEVMKPLPVKFIIDNVLSNQPLSNTIAHVVAAVDGVNNKTTLLLMCILAMIILIAGGALISFTLSQLTTRICQRMVHDLSLDLFDRLQQLSLRFHSKNKVGELLQRLSGDVYVVYSMVAHIILPSVTSLASLAAMFYIMAQIDLLLACIAISVVPALMLLLYFFNKPMSESTVQQYSLLGEFSSFIQQTLSSIKIIQAYSRENYIRKKFRQQSEAYGNAFITSTRISVLYVTLTGVITGTAGAIIIGVGAFRSLQGQLSIGELFIFLGYIAALFGPVNSLSSMIATAVTIGARARRIFELMDSNEIIIEKPDAIDIDTEHIRGDIRFEHITFGYGKHPGETSAVLNDFNFEVRAGQTIAVIGPTGAGKTSVISLLLRFYDPWKGKIYLDGRDIRDIKVSSLRNAISLVLQDAFIFPMTIAENIGFGNPEAGMDDIIEAAKISQAHEFISRLPNGYHTVASEGGVTLSGGEKQRISLARAFLRRSSVLILDEPTSALDVETESKIFSALADYAKNKTVFLITHRLSTIKHADLILSIKDGAIAEQGTHHSLINNDHGYAQLFRYNN